MIPKLSPRLCRSIFFLAWLEYDYFLWFSLVGLMFEMIVDGFDFMSTFWNYYLRCIRTFNALSKDMPATDSELGGLTGFMNLYR